MALKSVEISPSIQARPELHALARRATEQLEIVVLRSIDPVSARWNLEEDEKGRPLPRLVLSNWAGSVEGYFLPDEMRDAFQVQGRMRELWDDLLKLATHKLLEELHAAPVTVTAQDAV